MAQYSAVLRQAMLSVANGVLGSGARFVIYSGPVPLFAEAPLSDNDELASLQMSSTAFGGASGSPGKDVLTAANNLLTDTDASATGSATFWRIVDSSNQSHIQGTVGVNADDDLRLNSTAIQIHAAVSVTGPALVLPA